MPMPKCRFLNKEWLHNRNCELFNEPVWALSVKEPVEQTNSKTVAEKFHFILQRVKKATAQIDKRE